jgi:hypothetical protein
MRQIEIDDGSDQENLLWETGGSASFLVQVPAAETREAAPIIGGQAMARSSAGGQGVREIIGT